MYFAHDSPACNSQPTDANVLFRTFIVRRQEGHQKNQRILVGKSTGDKFSSVTFNELTYREAQRLEDTGLAKHKTITGSPINHLKK
jgi:hypothetical protein